MAYKVRNSYTSDEFEVFLDYLDAVANKDLSDDQDIIYGKICDICAEFEAKGTCNFKELIALSSKLSPRLAKAATFLAKAESLTESASTNKENAVEEDYAYFGMQNAKITTLIFNGIFSKLKEKCYYLGNDIYKGTIYIGGLYNCDFTASPSHCEVTGPHGIDYTKYITSELGFWNEIKQAYKHCNKIVKETNC